MANNKKKSGSIGFILVGSLAACGCAGPLSITIVAAAVVMIIVKILLTPICAPLDWFGWHPGPCKIWAAMKSVPSPKVKDVKMGSGSWSIAINALNGAYFLCKDKCTPDDPLNTYDPNDNRQPPALAFDVQSYFPALQANGSTANQASDISFVKAIYQISNKGGAQLPVPASVTTAGGYWDAFGQDSSGNDKIAGWTEYANDGQVGQPGLTVHGSQQTPATAGHGPLPGDIVVWTGGPNNAGYIGIVVSIVDKNGAFVMANANTTDPPTSGSVYIAVAGTPGNMITTQTNPYQDKYPNFPFMTSPGVHLLKIDFGSNGKLNDAIPGNVGNYTLAGFIRNSSLVVDGSSQATGDAGAGNGPANTTLPQGLSVGLPQGVATQYQQYVQIAENDATKYGYNPILFARQINQESGFDPNNTGPYVCDGDGNCGRAEGIGQFMSYRQDNFNHWDPVASLDHAAQEMASAYKRYLAGSDNSPQAQIEAYKLALADYNCGSGCVSNAMHAADRRGGRWTDYMPQETRDYIRIIMGVAP